MLGRRNLSLPEPEKKFIYMENEQIEINKKNGILQLNNWYSSWYIFDNGLLRIDTEYKIMI